MNQSTSHVMMVRPASFQFNIETAASNEFQNNVDLSALETNQKAQAEFDTMVQELEIVGINVHVIEDTMDVVRPDAIFPNNWISLSPNGVLTIFPMKNENRQREVRDDIIEWVHKDFDVKETIDLRYNIDKNIALEGTGSIVFDHIHRVAYACISPRTDIHLFQQYCTLIGYKPVIFHSYDTLGKLIYHTNVVMCIGTGYVVIGLDSVHNIAEREFLVHQFANDNLEVIDLSNEQLLKNFAGNMLQVANAEGKLYLVMSKRAYGSLTEIQKNSIEKYATMLPTSIDMIETIGGGSARCMMAEIFLESK